ncbi:MAG: methyltransferase domain-containing protein [Proteobacteria bacterium]|nr:methyltransferase domain-containing protein [Pseudomonadota bacterium]
MSIYAAPRHVDDLSTCTFYHAMDLPGVGSVPGNWDLRGRFEDYTANVALARARFLDIGTASGFLSFEAEKRGAEVVSFDSASRASHHHVPYREVRTDPATYGATAGADNDDYTGLRNSYWLAHRLLGSRARCFYGNVYDLPAELGEFDVVMVGQILGHLRDPLGALTSIAARCRGTMIITDNMLQVEQPVAAFSGNINQPVSPIRHVVWWQLSPVLIRNFLQILGLESVSFAINQYAFGPPDGPKNVMALSTLAAVRTEPAA